MTFTTTINTTNDIEVSATTQNFDTQLSILNDKGFNQKLLNLRLLSKFEGDLEKVEKRLTQIQKNQSSHRERILNQYQSSIDQLSQRGFSDHPRLPALLKKFDGDVDQIISFIERSSAKPKKDKAHPKKIKDHTKAKGLKNKDRSASPSPSPSPPSDLEASPSPIEETSNSSSTSSSSSSSSCSDPTPTPSTVETLPTTIESPVPDQTPKSSNDKAERKAKKQALKQQIRELQAQMKEIKDFHSAQKEEKERKKKERQEKLILREAKILKNLSDLKIKSSKTNEMIQRQEDQLVKIRSFLSAQA